MGYYYGSFFDRTMIILIPALIISIWAQMKIKSSYTKYSQVYSRNGYTGSQVARMILDAYGLFGIPVLVTGGHLTDHYDPSKKVVKLSTDVYNGTSLAAIGVAAHEIGHAIQHKEGYAPIKIRTALVPIANIGSQASWILFFIGIVMSFTPLVNFGIILFSAAVLFQIVTLPVEFNASSRAVAILSARNILYEDEVKGAKNVLTAAALTYVAAAVTAIAQLLRLIAIRNRND
ncbi:zinc metallopeptidase [Clostridium sp. UBA871]|uniref:zinc metallopeptidase n=1 Tax=Clostridium sp. UBA871 TaxID=1946380 RepID=UPI0032170AAC